MREPYLGNDMTVTVLHGAGKITGKPTLDVARYLIVVSGSESGKKLELGLDTISVGRHPQNVFALADPFVSGRHCEISFETGEVWVADLGSTNGTFVDGVRVNGRAPWPEDASLQIGNQVLRQEYRAREEIQKSAQLAEEIRRAAAYMRSLLPPPLTDESLSTDWHFLPSSELGGDIFDYYWLDSGQFVFHLIDVSGHGIGAALHSASVSNLLRQRFLNDVDFSRPGQVLAALNRALPMERYGSMYFTLWYGVYNPEEHLLRYASAGHPPALLFYEQGRRRADLHTENPPIGIVDQIQFLEAAKSLALPSSLYLYSDGVFEITRKTGDLWTGEEFAGYLQEQVRANAGHPEALYRSVRAFTRADRFEDDFSLLRVNFGG